MNKSSGTSEFAAVPRQHDDHPLNQQLANRAVTLLQNAAQYSQSFGEGQDLLPERAKPGQRKKTFFKVSDSPFSARLLDDAPLMGANNPRRTRCRLKNTFACTAAHPAKINLRLRRCRRCSPPLTHGSKNSKPISSILAAS